MLKNTVPRDCCCAARPPATATMPAKKSAGDPYVLLGVEPTASPAQIRKAYHRLALKVHPDKNPSAEAVASFQALQKAYSLLSNPEKRRRYDRTGCTDEESQSFDDAYSHYRSVYTEISKEDIDQFAVSYPDSEMEQNDLRDFYVKHEGDLKNLLHFIPLSTVDDCGRFVAFFEAAIAEGSLEDFPKFATSKSNIDPCDDEDGIDLNGEELGDDDDDEEDDVSGDDDDMADFLADDEDEEEQAPLAAAEEEQEQEEPATAPRSKSPAKPKARKQAPAEKTGGAPKRRKAAGSPENKETKKKKPKGGRASGGGGGGGGGGGAGLDGIDPALLAMFASRNAERESGMDAFEARWAAKAKDGGGGSKPTKKKKKTTKKKQTR
jgi:DnaJ family protein C protein 9